MEMNPSKNNILSLFHHQNNIKKNYLQGDRLYSKYDDNNSDPTYDVNRVST